MAVEAAVEATSDAGTSHYTTAEKFQLNEQWVHSYVGFRVNDLLRKRFSDDHPYITFETSVGWLVDIANTEPRKGRPRKAFSKGKRFDLVVWDDQSRVSGVIEIKDTPYLQKSSITVDCDKIKSAIETLETVGWGLFLYSNRASNVADGQKRAMQLDNKSKASLNNVKDSLSNFDIVSCSSKADSIGDCRIIWTGVLIQPMTGG